MNLKLIKGMRIVAATHNPGKVPEIAALLGQDYEILTAGQLNLPEPEETETTFAGNAMLKARHAAQLFPLYLLSAAFPCWSSRPPSPLHA